MADSLDHAVKDRAVRAIDEEIRKLRVAVLNLGRQSAQRLGISVNSDASSDWAGIRLVQATVENIRWTQEEIAVAKRKSVEVLEGRLRERCAETLVRMHLRTAAGRMVAAQRGDDYVPAEHDPKSEDLPF